MKVSICCITYNHQAYIGQAIDSMLMQQTNFDFEIIIGEDCSTDNTLAILREYQQKYPNKIQVIKRPEEIGLRKNFVETLFAGRGEYIAICEGDDYWTDPLKLQKQVDFMDAHPDFEMCFHNCHLYFQDTGKKVPSNKPDQKEVTDVYDLINDWYIMTCSMFFRNKIKKVPDWFVKSFNTDYALQLLLLADGGKIGYLPDMMGVYRKHSAGESRRTWGPDPFFWLLFLFNKFDAETNHRYSAAIQKRKAEIVEILADYYRKQLTIGSGNYTIKMKNLVRYYSMKVNAPGYYYRKFLYQKNLS